MVALLFILLVMAASVVASVFVKQEEEKVTRFQEEDIKEVIINL